MRILIPLITLFILQTSTAQNFQSFSFYGGVEQKGFREPNYGNGIYTIRTSSPLTLPSLRFGATYKLTSRLQLHAQVSNQPLFEATVNDTYDERATFKANQRVLDIGVRRHKKHAPLGRYIGLNFLVSSTHMAMISTHEFSFVPKQIQPGTATNFGLKFTTGKTKLISNSILLDWGISYQFYPTNFGRPNISFEDESSVFYQQEGARTTLKDDFKQEISDILIDKCGRIAFYFNIGFASVGIK